MVDKYSHVWITDIKGSISMVNHQNELFLVYINDLPQGLRYNAKFFADNTSHFSTIASPAISSSNPNEALLKETLWAYQ